MCELAVPPPGKVGVVFIHITKKGVLQPVWTGKALLGMSSFYRTVMSSVKHSPKKKKKNTKINKRQRTSSDWGIHRLLLDSVRSGPQVIKLFSCSTQLSMRFSLLINMKMLTKVGIFILAEKISCSAVFSNKEFAIVSYLRFISMKNFMLSWVEHEKKLAFSYLLAEKISCSAMFSNKELQLLVIWDLLTWQISCSAELSMKKYLFLLTSGPDCRSRDHKFESQLRHITVMEIDCEIVIMVILSLRLIQEGQLSVTTKSIRLCTQSTN